MLQEVIKVSSNGDDLMVVDEEEGMPWASPSLDTWVFLNVQGDAMGVSQSLSFCPFFTFLLHPLSWNLKTPFTQNFS